jgi:hypothetical protein
MHPNYARAAETLIDIRLARTIIYLIQLFSLMRSARSAPVAALSVAGESAKDKIGQPIVPAFSR